MLIVCPNCATSYQVDPSSLGAAGRSVRCARCKKTWFAGNPEAIAAIARSHQEDLVAFSPTGAVSEFARERAPTPAPSPTSTHAEGFPVLDAAPPPVPPDTTATPPVPTLPADDVPRDDRGPAPLPEPVEQPPSAPPIAVVSPPAVPEPAEAVLAMAAPADIESAAQRMRRKAARRRADTTTRRWVMAILVLVAINIGLVAWRADIVRLLPQTASLYSAIGLPVNLRGLVFSEIVTRKELQDSVQMLVVEGVVKSSGKRNTDVPRLRFSVRNVRGQEIYSWTSQPTRNMLAPGGVMPFRTRLASPPPEAHAVLVRFFNRRDLVAGIQ